MKGKFIHCNWYFTNERPKGRVEKAASLQIGGGSEKTYFAPNGTFKRIHVPKSRMGDGYTAWMKLDPFFIREDGSFMR